MPDPGKRALLRTLRETEARWWALGWIGGLLLVCYGPILYLLGKNWAADQDMGHGFFVPIVAGFVVWQRRATLAQLPLQPNIWGLVIVAVSGLQALAATLGAELFTARLAF